MLGEDITPLGRSSLGGKEVTSGEARGDGGKSLEAS